MTHWIHHGVMIIHPMRKSHANDMAVNPNLPSPLSYGKRLPVNRYKSVIASVIGLLLPCSPPAIFGRVIKRIVNPVQRHIVRALSHFDCKGLKRRLPFRANFYAAPTVVFKAFCRRVIASRNHTVPRFVLPNQLRPAVFRDSGFSGRSPLFVRKTAARPGGAFVQVRRLCNLSAATVAVTKPLSMPFGVIFHPAYSSQSTEFTASKVFSHRCSFTYRPDYLHYIT